MSIGGDPEVEEVTTPRGEIIGYRRERRPPWWQSRYLVRLHDGRQLWLWEDELDRVEEHNRKEVYYGP